MNETECSGLVHWDDAEVSDGEGGGRGFQDGENMYTHIFKKKKEEKEEIIFLKRALVFPILLFSSISLH